MDIKPYGLALIFGVVSAFLLEFVGWTIVSLMPSNIVLLLTVFGVPTAVGAAAAYGYFRGGGPLKTETDAKYFMWLMGIIGVVGAYIYLQRAVGVPGISQFLIYGIFGGYFFGRWGGGKVGYRLVLSQAHIAQGEVVTEALSAADSKFGEDKTESDTPKTKTAPGPKHQSKGPKSKSSK